MTPPLTVVIDTNVLVAAVRSRRGASFQLLSLIGTPKLQISISVPLVLEYEAVLLREADKSLLTRRDIRDLVDYLCAVGKKQQIFFLWRPYLPDVKDDLILELAVASDCDYIVTFNQRDFKGVEQFGVRVIYPRNLLTKIGAQS